MVLQRQPLKRAVALSGGPDSLLAAALMPPGLALIVDHGLRPGSRQEAEQAAAQATSLGHESKILTWQHGEVPKTQAAYRAGRYALLAQACQRAEIEELWTGHQEDDQTETLMLRLSKGSGLMGLSGMAKRTWLGNTRLFRPLLTVGKAKILEELELRGLEGIQDPSNHDPAYPRVIWRAYLLSKPELKRQLVDLAQRIGELRNLALSLASELPIQPCAPGHIFLDSSLKDLPFAAQYEVLAACVRWVGGKAFAPLEPMLRFLSSPQKSAAAATAGSTILTWRQAKGAYELRPEQRRPSDPDPMASREMETRQGLWLPGNQARYGGLIIGEAPRLDHEFATKNTPSPFKD